MFKVQKNVPSRTCFNMADVQDIKTSVILVNVIAGYATV